ncbi:MAG TPA: response regulator [Frankiaceae bacterium]|nr:response regulator [Frankiaceae bacterium]
MSPRRVVLVVDDEAITRDVVGAMLEMEDVEVHTAHDGETALAMAGDVRPDLVLLDVMMPGIDGMEVCRRLTADDGGPRVVMLTAKADPESRQIAAAAGASAYLSKPFSAVDLFKVVEGELTGGL